MFGTLRQLQQLSIGFSSPIVLEDPVTGVCSSGNEPSGVLLVPLTVFGFHQATTVCSQRTAR